MQSFDRAKERSVDNKEDDIKINDITDLGALEEYKEEAMILAGTDDFRRLMAYFRCAIMEVETKLNVLNEEFSLQYDRNPFEQIESRIKNPVSIVEKVHRIKRKDGNDGPVTVADIERMLNDVAGIRIVCSFKEDIYRLLDLLVQQDDVLIVSRKDYIDNPKPNGYRSLHIVIVIPIFLSSGKKYMNVEVQLRTIAMDFWASVDHKLKYKKKLENPEEITLKLAKCADILADLDEEMTAIRAQIDSENTFAGGSDDI